MQQLTRIDRYELGTVLGSGATGIVYLGRDTKLDREVAVKVMNPDVAGNAAARSLFHREAKAIAKLTHPNIIALHDYSGADSDLVYIVVERLRGQNLRELVERRGKPLGPVAAAAAAHEICLALAHAHEQGIIHRDLKPENVFLEPEGRVVLCDFGIARDYRSSLQHTLASRNTTLAGSPMYMSPEQILTPQSVGPASDLFSLGSVLYFLASGSHAFHASSMHKVLKAVSEAKYPALKDVAPEYGDIVRKLLQRDAERRYGTARQVANDLLSYLHTSKERDPRRALMALAEQGRSNAALAVTQRDVGGGELRNTMIMLVQKKNKEPAQIVPDQNAPIPLKKHPMHEDTPSEPKPQPARLGVLFWSVIAATLILLAGLAVAELEAFSGLRTWLQSSF